MPVSESRLYGSRRLNRWFLISSVLMTASIIWMVWEDSNRAWHDHQDSFFVGKAALAHLNYLRVTTKERTQEIERAKQQLEEAEAQAQVYADRRQALQEELESVALENLKAGSSASRLTQVVQVSSDDYERSVTAHGPDHPDTQEFLSALESQRQELAELERKSEETGDRKKELEQTLKTLDEPVITAEKHLRDLRQVVETARDKELSYWGVPPESSMLSGLVGDFPVVKRIINLPLLDFSAPKNTPARRQVNQLVLPDIRQQLNYLDTYTTDRCTTCHVAINDPEFSQDQLARTLEQSLPAINEALQRAGKQPYPIPAPPELSEPNAPKLQAGQVTQHWSRLTGDQQDAYFESLLTFVNRYLKESSLKQIELGQPLLAHPNLELFVSVDSPHAMNEVGCTVCHSGNPQETEFVLAAHSPATHEIEGEWAEKYYDHNLGVPATTFETMAHYWDRPMYLPKYTEAGCAQCHTHISDISRFHGKHVGDRINLGKHLFKNLGCINCHNVDSLAGSRRVGPDLTYIASKLTPGFTQQWIWSPRSFRPSTTMPHFFRQENNLPESANEYDPDPILRTQTEVAGIAKYLFVVSREWEAITPATGTKGDMERGRQLFGQVGCLACHANMTEYGEGWITKDIVHRESVDEETARYRYKGMTYEQRVRYAMEHFIDEKDSFLEPETAQFDPDDDYHPPIFSRFAPELSGIGSKVTEEWLYSWLMNPQHYAQNTKMPSLRLTPGEAADLAAYLMTLRNDAFLVEAFDLNPSRLEMLDDLVFSLLTKQRSERSARLMMNDENGELTATMVSLLKTSLGQQEARDRIESLSLQDRQLTYLGSKMIAHYGCFSCHLIAGFEEATPVGTDLTKWGEKPLSQLDFAFYDEAFHEVREKQEDVFGYIYPPYAKELRYWSPVGDAHEQITHRHAAFAYHKMVNPRIWDREKIKKPYDKLKMPNFFFSDEDADALTTYLLSRRSGLVNESVKVDYEGSDYGAISAGRDLTRELNCVACHQIEDNAPLVQQYFRRTLGGKPVFDEPNAPPRLWGQGAKVQHHWMHRFFAQVEPLRPWLAIRMPSFWLTNDQRTTLVKYFAALSLQDSHKLEKWISGIHEYKANARVAVMREGDDPEEIESAGSDWFRVESQESRAENLRRFAIERKLVRAQVLDMLAVPESRLQDAHEQVLERTTFLKDLYNVEYPFVEPPRQLADPEVYARGMSFLTDMGCLKCHVLGNVLPGPAKTTDDFVQTYRLDGVRGEGENAFAILNGTPYPVGSVIDGFTLVSAENIYYDTGDIETKAVIEGPNKNGETERIQLQAASAPNLGLTYERLRRDWVVSWMLQPAWIQPGTKMPQNFAGGRSPFEGDPKYPGTSKDHIDLLVDTLFDAGAKRVRVLLPRRLVTTEEEFDEDGGGGELFDEEEFDE